MSSNLRIFSLMLVVVSIFVFTQSLFIIMPNESGLVVHLGSLRQDGAGSPKVYTPGIYLKIPIADRLIRLDRRLQSVDLPSTRVLTQDKKSVLVDYYTRWLVSDFAKFFQRTGGSFFRAQEILKRKISDALRAEFGVRNLSDIISGEERNLIVQRMRELANESAENLGITVWDVRLKRVDYPQEVTLSVYERMKSSRHRDAKRYRSEGQAKAVEIQAEADKDAAIIVSQAKREAADVVATARREASKIYNDAYSQAPDFYEFFLKMQGYNTAVGRNELMLINPESDQFFNLLAEK